MNGWLSESVAALFVLVSFFSPPSVSPSFYFGWRFVPVANSWIFLFLLGKVNKKKPHGLSCLGSAQSIPFFWAVSNARCINRISSDALRKPETGWGGKESFVLTFNRWFWSRAVCQVIAAASCGYSQDYDLFILWIKAKVKKEKQSIWNRRCCQTFTSRFLPL